MHQKKPFKIAFALVLSGALVLSSNALPPFAAASTEVSAIGTEKRLVPCGTPFGIRLFTSGVMVVGTADIPTAQGNVNPPAKAGIKVGDIVTSVNGKAVNSNEEVAEAIEKSGGSIVHLGLLREGKEFTAALQPVQSAAGYRAGLWVRDSTAGIGTLTFYDPESNSFAGLGHGICDADTGEIMPLLNGDIVPVSIIGVQKGQQGAAGELKGFFSSDDAMGTLQKNIGAGVYGTMAVAPQGDALPVLPASRLRTGPVQIYCTVEGETPKLYDAKIEFTDCRAGVTKNMVLRVTDPLLLEKTGGIVQGMSGSPIIQDGYLVGAVTHVFVNDPTRGYGILAENMLSACGLTTNSAAA